MQFSQEMGVTTYVIRSYGPGEVVVAVPISREELLAPPESEDGNGPRLRYKTLNHSAIIAPTSLIEDWPPGSVDEVRQDTMQQVADLEPEIVLLGTGGRIQWPNPQLGRAFTDAGIGFEVMDTPSACRTYNILMFEGRKVAAALLI